MTTTIPTKEPTSFRSGDTVAWTKSLNDYPADDGWVLTYRLTNLINKIDITSTADGALHSVSLLASVTKDYEHGTYNWFAQVTKALERYTVGNGTLTIQPDIAAAGSDGFDLRCNAEKILDIIEQAMLTHGSQAYTQSYSIAGRQMNFRTLSDFMSYRSKLQFEVATFKQLNEGKKPANKMLVRFT